LADRDRRVAIAKDIAGRAALVNWRRAMPDSIGRALSKAGASDRWTAPPTRLTAEKLEVVLSLLPSRSASVALTEGAPDLSSVPVCRFRYSRGWPHRASAINTARDTA